MASGIYRKDHGPDFDVYIPLSSRTAAAIFQKANFDPWWLMKRVENGVLRLDPVILSKCIEWHPRRYSTLLLRCLDDDKESQESDDEAEDVDGDIETEAEEEVESESESSTEQARLEGPRVSDRQPNHQQALPHRPQGAVAQPGLPRGSSGLSQAPARPIPQQPLPQTLEQFQRQQYRRLQEAQQNRGLAGRPSHPEQHLPYQQPRVNPGQSTQQSQAKRQAGPDGLPHPKRIRGG